MSGTRRRGSSGRAGCRRASAEPVAEADPGQHDADHRGPGVERAPITGARIRPASISSTSRQPLPMNAGAREAQWPEVRLEARRLLCLARAARGLRHRLDATGAVSLFLRRVLSALLTRTILDDGYWPRCRGSARRTFLCYFRKKVGVFTQIAGTLGTAGHRLPFRSRLGDEARAFQHIDCRYMRPFGHWRAAAPAFRIANPSQPPRLSSKRRRTCFPAGPPRSKARRAATRSAPPTRRTPINGASRSSSRRRQRPSVPSFAHGCTP